MRDWKQSQAEPEENFIQNLKPTYEGLKAIYVVAIEFDKENLKPTYEGLKVCNSCVGEFIPIWYLKPTYEGLKEREGGNNG